jgi:drug/metabolite transporter (DMT)-like permease
MRRDELLGTSLTLASAVGFGISGTVSRLAAADGVDAIGFVTWRAAIASAAIASLLAVLVWRRGMRLPVLAELGRRDRTALTVVTVFSALVNLAMFLAFTRTTIGVAMICFYTYPGLVTLGAARFGGEPIDRRRALALLVGSLGLVFVLGPSIGAAAGNLDLLGVGLALGASFLQAITVLLVGRGFGSVPAIVTGLLMNGFSAIVYAAIGFVVGAGTTLAVTGGGATVEVLVGGLLGGAVPTVCNLTGIQLIGAGRAAILMMLEAVVGVSMAAVFLAQRPAAIQVLGGVAVLIAGGILQLPRRGRLMIVEPVHPTV